MSLLPAVIQAITKVLQEIKPPPAINAMALNLPTFWLAHPAMWFTQVEAQFTTCQPQIEVDLTVYNYAEATLDNAIAGEVEILMLSPPTENKYLPSRAHS